MYFASDNTAGMAPEILDALAKANTGYALGYGNDEWTKRVEQRFAEIFEKEVAVFLVPTGTAANALAIAHLSPPWGAVLCHEGSHIATDECGAPEFFGGGLKLIGLQGEGAKVSAATLRAALEGGQWGGPHHVSPSVLSLSQATECGTIYRVAETKELADIAHKHGVTVHMDGARLGNALARMNVSPAEATWKAGVDALSFGATKGGAMGAEAVIFFDRARRRDAEPAQARRRARLQAPLHRGADRGVSGRRSVASPCASCQRDGGRAGGGIDEGRMQTGLAGRGERGFRADHGGDGQAAESRGRDVLPVAERGLPKDRILVRLVTSFQTTSEDVEKFLAIVRS